MLCQVQTEIHFYIYAMKSKLTLQNTTIENYDVIILKLNQICSCKGRQLNLSEISFTKITEFVSRRATEETDFYTD